jgi:hypothetical protein
MTPGPGINFYPATVPELLSLKQNLLSVFQKTWMFFLLNDFAISKVTSAQETMSRVSTI